VQDILLIDIQNKKENCEKDDISKKKSPPPPPPPKGKCSSPIHPSRGDFGGVLIKASSK